VETPECRLAIQMLIDPVLPIQMLIDAVEDRGPMLFAKMGIEGAANRNVEIVLNPSHADPHQQCRKLARDW
jgi:hypothetical protein